MCPLVTRSNQARFLIFHSTISLFFKKFLFSKISDDIIAFLCPSVKNPGYAYAPTAGNFLGKTEILMPFCSFLEPFKRT